MIDRTNGKAVKHEKPSCGFIARVCNQAPKDNLDMVATTLGFTRGVKKVEFLKVA